jgi:hypothetical protein
MSDPCPICSGAAKRDCICGGTGKLIDAFNHTSALWIKEKNEHEATQQALSSMQKAVLGFVFHPVFRKMDYKGFFRRYWEDKLECKLSFGIRPRVSVRPEDAGQQVPRLTVYKTPSSVIPPPVKRSG